MRLAIVTNIPTHYREPLYARIAQLAQREGGVAHVIYAASRDSGQRWPQESGQSEVAATYLRESVLRLRERAILADPRVIAALERVRPTVIVVGAYAPWTYLVSAWARIRRVPVLIWSAETIPTARLHGSRRLRRWPLIRNASGFLAYGPAAADYLRASGVTSREITVVGNGIDVDAFADRVEAVRGERDRIRESFSLYGPTALCVGAKGVDIAVPAAIQALAHLAIAGPPIDLSSPAVTHLGMHPPSEMPRLYVAADCLIHTPAADYWPHAINEALAAGLPVVASPTTGVPSDILEGPGCAVVPRDVAAVAEAVVMAIQQNHVASADVREAIRAPLRPWAVESMAERFVAAAKAVAR
jgi:glycosyltransferase involved in cell wall biosynthesis